MEPSLPKSRELPWDRLGEDIGAENGVNASYFLTILMPRNLTAFCEATRLSGLIDGLVGYSTAAARDPRIGVHGFVK